MESISFLSWHSSGSEQDYGGLSAQCPQKRDRKGERGKCSEEESVRHSDEEQKESEDHI